MKLINDLVALYKNEPVNIALKSRNFCILIFVLTVVSLVLFPVCIIKGQTTVLPIIFLILGFCVISYVLLRKKQYRLSTSIFFTLLGVLPLFLAFSQESQVYRDVYLYFFFCAPFLVLSAIAGYKKRQIILVSGMQIVCALIYVFTRVLRIPNVTSSNVFFCLVIGTAFHLMITCFLMVNLKLEEKIIATLSHGQKQAENQLLQLQNLVNQVRMILNSVQNVSVTLESHVVSLAETMDTVQQIDYSINKISSEAKKHSVSVSKLSDAINNTKTVLEKNIHSVDKLKQSAKDVFNVITVIEDVTEQTNLLAINASIEASHAGEFGKGFAVVANEIKTLAEKTTQNSKKIKEVLDITNKDLIDVDIDIKNTVEEFEKTTEATQTVNYALTSILEGSSQVACDATQIANIMSDLAGILKSINSEMSEIAANINDSTMEFAYISDD